ncbi:MAG: hypothetical protein ACI9UK_002008 [Candidatus Krumholzibacteriia bacterium]|jgi:hypothetical protein
MRIAKALKLVACLLVVGVGLTGCSSSKSYDESMNLGGINMGEALAGLISHTQQVMANVTDLSSAERAKADLHRINQDYDDLLFNVPKMSEDGQFALAMQARQSLPQMQDVSARISQVPVLHDIIGVELDEITAKLAQLQ